MSLDIKHNIKRARQSLKAYGEATGDPYDVQAAFTDLLTDLMHYAKATHAKDARNPSFDDVLETARGHFEAELRGEI